MNVNYYNVSVGDVSERMKDALNRMPDVEIDVLFSSVLTRAQVRDLNVEVFIEGEPNFKRMVEIAGVLEDYARIPIYVVPLNNAPSKLKLKALSKGVRLVVRDSRLYSLPLNETPSEAMDVDLKLNKVRVKGHRRTLPSQKANRGEIESLRLKLSSIREPCVKAILLFGSKARGESGDRSDVDLLVLHEGCRIHDAVLRRRHLYNVLREAVEGVAGLTVIDMELQRFLNPEEISPLLLNIYWDAIVLHDSTCSVETFLRRVRERISASGLKRVRSGRTYHWVLPEPLKKVKIL